MTIISRRAAIRLLSGAGVCLADRAVVSAAGVTDLSIGALYPLSGPDAALGESAEMALRTAVEMVHGDYDLDLPMARADNLPNIPGGHLRYIMTDHRNDPALARKEAERLVTSEKIVALMGAADERVAEVLRDVAERAGIPFVDTDSKVEPTQRRPLKYSFRLAATENVRIKTTLEFITALIASRPAGPKSLALLHDAEPATLIAVAAMRDASSKSAIQLSAVLPFTRGHSANLGAAVDKLRTEVGAVLVLGSAADAATLIDREIPHEKTAAVVSYPTTSADRARSNAFQNGQGLFVASGFTRDLHTHDSAIAAINTLYRSFARKDLDELAALQFTGMLTLAYAINEARGGAPQELTKRLAFAQFPGDRTIMPWTDLSFDGSGQNSGANVAIVQRQHAKLVTVYLTKDGLGPVQ